MKRILCDFPLVGMMMAFCLLLAGCGPDAPAAPEVVPATIRWATWEVSSRSEEMLVQKFQEENPQIDFDRLSQVLSTDMTVNATPPPDLVNVDAGWELTQLAASGRLADLTEMWEESGLAENVPAGIQQVSAFQDRQFYIPVAVGWKAIYYNKQIFADYNLTPPASWDEFLAICDTLLANGEIPLSVAGIDPWTTHGWFEYLNLRMNGAQFYRDLIAGKERYDDPRVRAVMERWQSLFTNGYFIEEPERVSELSSMMAIIRGDNGRLDGPRAVMVLASTYGYGSMPAPFQAEVDFFRFPIMDSSIPVAEVVEPFGYVVPLGADHLPAAMRFLEYVSSSQAQLLAAQLPIYSTIHYLPARSDVDGEMLSVHQRNGLAMVSEAEDAVISFEYVSPPQMVGTVGSRFKAFVRKPEDIDTFILKLEEARQQMVDSGLLLTE